MKFTWDKEKEKINLQKHAVSFEEAAYVFSDPFALSIYDQEHATEEDRWILMGKSFNNILLVVVHTIKNDENIEIVRIISARKATKKEQQYYQTRSHL